MINLREEMPKKTGSNSDFAVFIRMQMARLNLSSGDMARRCEVDVSTVTSWRIGRCVPRVSMLPKIAKALRTDVSTLLEHV